MLDGKLADMVVANIDVFSASVKVVRIVDELESALIVAKEGSRHCEWSCELKKEVVQPDGLMQRVRGGDVLGFCR